jgi:6-phosphofructokinase
MSWPGNMRNHPGIHPVRRESIAQDRILARRLGVHAIELIAQNAFGLMDNIIGGGITPVSLAQVRSKLRIVQANLPLIRNPRKMGIYFGTK